jgi:hypothetical protein
MKIIFLILFILPLFTFSQIKISKAGDEWDKKIDSALNVVKTTDPKKYEVIVSVCGEVSFWLGDFSSCELTKEDVGRIYVAVKDVKLNSINNLASILVHESLHLYFRKKQIILPENIEENYCYLYEWDFLAKIPKVETWLLKHTLKQIKQTTNEQNR